VRKLAALILLGIGLQALCAAAVIDSPEIDPASGASALALLTGAVALIRGRRKS
jgi:hypothetical protein